MPRSSRDEEFSAFVQTRRTGLVRSACLLTAGDTHLAEDLVQTALARLYVAWPKVRRAGTESAYVWRIIVNAHIDEVRRPGRRRERPGMFDVQDDIQSLTFQIAGGQWVVVQAPVSLGWNSAELAQFASGVQVLVTAQQGRG